MRFVIQNTLSKSIESDYQESRRAEGTIFKGIVDLCFYIRRKTFSHTVRIVLHLLSNTYM
jgi:hypothetical protein